MFWEWLLDMASNGTVKIPVEQYEEITNGKGPIVDWCKDGATRAALVLAEEASQKIVARVTREGYANDLTEDEVEQISQTRF